MKSLLSVQSHVAHGYVGGRAATFPLQYLGWDVDNINTVNFSNHTGYGHFQGSAIPEPELIKLFQGLNQIGCSYDVVVLGYIPSAELIDVVASEVAALKKSNPSTRYVCDTVMGDQGHLYVNNSCVDAYRKLLSTKIADVITPNQFELELLYGKPIDSEKLLRDAIAYMHDTYGVDHVVISSLDASVLNLQELQLICCAVSSRFKERSQEQSQLQVFLVPEIKSYFTGVGDLFTALLADKLFTNNGNLVLAVNQVLTIMSNVLKLTHQLGIKEFTQHYGEDSCERLAEGRMNDGESMRFFELRIIQAREFYDYSGAGEFSAIEISN
ncbi:hypothetical protein PUMCH_003780 [Australozyma saopauloensis]|uniref:pyridoxal kinase n=1 Tax=Australozyma saopauloensis TaxID=291208 RepID=A0AAX4HCY3_9ASCO|nr:hypothetical protein PUMCH_003780 [[Candida] saopauloensis]